CTPKTSCSPAATRNSTAAWKTTPSTMLRPRWIRAGLASHLPRVDPVVEAHTGGLLDLLGAHGLQRVDRDEVVLVLVRGEALEERRLHDVVLAVAPRAGERLDLDPLEGLDHLIDAGPLAAGRLGRPLDPRLVGDDGEDPGAGLVIRPLL